MANIGFEFRNSQAYVTTAAADTYVLDTTTYPTTRTINGVSVTFGWEAIVAGNSRDRNNGGSNNPKLAGMCYAHSSDGADAVFRVDLTAGTYDVHLAMGDPGFSNQEKYELRDNATARITKAETATTNGDYYFDASGVERNPAGAWLSSNVAVACNISSGILRLVLQRPATVQSAVSYMQIDGVSAGGGGGGSTGAMLLGFCG